METITVNNLFVLGIISIILNSMFILTFVIGYVSIAVLYCLASIINFHDYQSHFSIFATIVELVGFFAIVTTALLTLVGSYLGVSQNKKQRKASFILLIVSISILFVHFIANTFILTFSLVFYAPNVINVPLLYICGDLLACIVLYYS